MRETSELAPPCAEPEPESPSESVSDAAPDSAREAAAENACGAVDHSRAFCWLVRAGFASRAITYGIIGALTLALALRLGTLGAAPNQEGALALIARTLAGRVVLIAIAAGLLGYAVWKIGQAVRGRGPEGGGGKAIKDRAGNLAGGVVYLAFFAIAVRTLLGSGGNSASAPREAAAGVLTWPAGAVLIGLAGSILLGVSLYQTYDALSGGFADECWTDTMSTGWRRLFMHLGRVGLVARAGVFALVGYFLIRTAVEFNARSAVGIDGVLERLRNQPFGPWLVGTAAIGLLIFAAFSLAEGRHRRL